MTLPESLFGPLNPESLRTLLRVGAVLFGAFVLIPVVRRLILRALADRLSKQSAMLLRRVVTYILMAAVLTWVLRELGFEIGVLLGAAGILTVALGFASQTSVSNLISGLFLIGEQPFVIGDVITLDDLTGEVLSIDLLSIKLRTFDNLFVRVPNETVLKTRVTTLTRFPIRRFDMQLGVAYKENIGRVKEVLEEVAKENPLCLEEPKPLIIILGFGASSIDLQFSVWADRTKFLDMRNSLFEQVKEAFDAHGIEIPFPHRVLHTSSTTAPMPFTVLTPAPAPLPQEHDEAGESPKAI